MLIRVTGGREGIAEYLAHGQKQDRDWARDELDERVVLDGDLELTDAVIQEMEKEGERYLHITLAFKEDALAAETLKSITDDFKQFAMSAYEADEFNFYAEAHLPKIKSYTHRQTGESIERKPHIHIVIPEKNLLSGQNLNPFGKVDQQIKFLEAFQEHVNAKYGLASPKDHRRVKFTGESEMILAANSVLLLVCGGFVVITKVAMAFVLGVGPMFIACLAFPPVAKFFDAWVGKVLNYVFLVVILAFTIGLAISVGDSYMQHMLSSVQAGATNQVADAFGLIALYGTLVILIYQSPHIASGLAGGASLSGGGLGNLAQSAVVGKLAAAGRFSGGGTGGRGSGGGGTVGNASAKSVPNAGSAASASSGGISRRPAYRKATMDNLQNKSR